MNDIFGEKLKVGQTVAAAIGHGGSFELVRGKIVKLTNHMVRIKYQNRLGYEYNRIVSSEKIAIVPVWEATHQHFKGGKYRLIGYGRVADTLRPVAVYDDQFRELWVRDKDEFHGHVQPRFTPIIRED